MAALSWRSSWVCAPFAAACMGHSDFIMSAQGFTAVADPRVCSNMPLIVSAVCPKAVMVRAMLSATVGSAQTAAHWSCQRSR